MLKIRSAKENSSRGGDAQDTQTEVQSRLLLPWALSADALAQWFSKYEPLTNSISVTWQLVGNQNSWILRN